MKNKVLFVIEKILSYVSREPPEGNSCVNTY